MDDAVLIRYHWTADELLCAQRWHFRQRVRPAFRWALWIILTLMVLSGALGWHQTGSIQPSGYLFFVGLYLLADVFVLKPRRVHRQFAKRPDRDAEIEWRILAEIIHIRTPHTRSDVAWPAFAKVVQTPAGFLFYPNSQMFHWLPRSGFASDAEFGRLTSLAEQHATTFRRLL